VTKILQKKRWRYKNEKLNLLFIIENIIRVFLAFLEIAGCPSKNAGARSNSLLLFASILGHILHDPVLFWYFK